MKLGQAGSRRAPTSGRRLSFHWKPSRVASRVAIGGLLISIGGGLPPLLPHRAYVSFIGGMLFVAGLLVVVTGVVSLGRQPVVVHPQWDTQRVVSSLKAAHPDATIRILQTWFPEEDFFDSLRDRFVKDKKRFGLRVLLLDAEINPARTDDLLEKRVLLRGDFSRDKAIEEILTTIARLVHLKKTVDEQWRREATPGVRVHTLDLEIRRFSFLPFGPIYQIGADVMYVGFYLSYTTSLYAPMLEVRNTGDNELWEKFQQQLDRGWANAGSTAFYP
jgi:hypothetical protein